MNRTIGTVVRGVRAPIFREGDDVAIIAMGYCVGQASRKRC